MRAQSPDEFNQWISGMEYNEKRAHYFQKNRTALPGLVSDVNSFCKIFKHLQTSERADIFNELCLDWVNEIDSPDEAIKVLKYLNIALAKQFLSHLNSSLSARVELKKGAGLSPHKARTLQLFFKNQSRDHDPSTDPGMRSPRLF